MYFRMFGDWVSCDPRQLPSENLYKGGQREGKSNKPARLLSAASKLSLSLSLSFLCIAIVIIIIAFIYVHCFFTHDMYVHKQYLVLGYIYDKPSSS